MAELEYKDEALQWPEAVCHTSAVSTQAAEEDSDSDRESLELEADDRILQELEDYDGYDLNTDTGSQNLEESMGELHLSELPRATKRHLT